LRRRGISVLQALSVCVPFKCQGRVRARCLMCPHLAMICYREAAHLHAHFCGRSRNPFQGQYWSLVATKCRFECACDCAQSGRSMPVAGTSEDGRPEKRCWHFRPCAGQAQPARSPQQRLIALFSSPPGSRCSLCLPFSLAAEAERPPAMPTPSSHSDPANICGDGVGRRRGASVRISPFSCRISRATSRIE
jgi:hypothetical protein